MYIHVTSSFRNGISAGRLIVMYSTDKITSLTRQFLRSPPYFKLHTRPSVLPTLSRRTLQQISHWDPPLYDGSGDVKQWLAKVKRGCETLQVSKTQETDVAINFMEGEARVVFERMHKIKAESGNVWGWDEFGSDLVDIDGEQAVDVPLTRRLISPLQRNTSLVSARFILYMLHSSSLLPSIEPAETGDSRRKGTGCSRCRLQD